MNCPKCGKFVKKGAHFCSSCGSPLNIEKTVSAENNEPVNQKTTQLQSYSGKAVIIAFIVQICLWVLMHIVMVIMDNASALIGLPLLLVVCGILFVAPFVSSSRIDDEYGTLGLNEALAAVQGLFVVFPFLTIGSWGDAIGIEVLCIIGAAMVYVVAMTQLLQSMPEQIPEKTAIKYLVLQGVLGFAIGTIVGIIIAVVVALTNGTKRKRR